MPMDSPRSPRSVRADFSRLDMYHYLISLFLLYSAHGRLDVHCVSGACRQSPIGLMRVFGEKGAGL